MKFSKGTIMRDPNRLEASDFTNKILQRHGRGKQSKTIKFSAKRLWRYLVMLLITAGLIYLIYVLSFPPAKPPLIEGKALLYQSPYCGCCSNYAKYLEENGVPVQQVFLEDLSSIKVKYKIPAEMQSCHTVIIGSYFVEGHVPIEAIIKLIREKPSIAGIALPGMPAGSPGMSGSKTEIFIIYAIGYEGEISTFMRI